MRIEIIEEPLIDDIEIQIKCKEKNEYVEQLAKTICEKQLIINGRIENEYTQISSKEIYYFESVDNRTYIYCENNVYQSDMKLYELEEKVLGTEFIRINKACIMNISKLKKVRAQINGRLLATLLNGEKLIINRSYVKEVKHKLNI